MKTNAQGQTRDKTDRPTDRQTKRQRDRRKDRQTDRETDKRKGRTKAISTWAFVYSTLLRLVVVIATASPAIIRRWVCARTSSFSLASTTGFTTGRPRTPGTPATINCNRINYIPASTGPKRIERLDNQ